MLRALLKHPKHYIYQQQHLSKLRSLQQHPTTQFLLTHYKTLSQLTKFKLSVLNGLVTIGSFTIYQTGMPFLPLLGFSIMLSMSSQVMNQIIQVQYDRQMQRTCRRPLVTGFSKTIALFTSICLGAAGLFGLYYFYGLKSSLIGMSILIGYLLVYTRMKRTSTANTFVGAIVGALPVYLGWLCTSLSPCMIEPLGLFCYMVAWQQQHFFGIRWTYFHDYNQAGFIMEQSKSVAAAQTILQLNISLVLINSVIKCMVPTTMLPLFCVPATLTLLYWGIYSAIRFQQQTITPRQFKTHSYIHLLILSLILFVASFTSKHSPKKTPSLSQEQILFSVQI